MPAVWSSGDTPTYTGIASRPTPSPPRISTAVTSYVVPLTGFAHGARARQFGLDIAIAIPIAIPFCGVTQARNATDAAVAQTFPILAPPLVLKEGIIHLLDSFVNCIMSRVVTSFSTIIIRSIPVQRIIPRAVVVVVGLWSIFLRLLARRIRSRRIHCQWRPRSKKRCQYLPQSSNFAFVLTCLSPLLFESLLDFNLASLLFILNGGTKHGDLVVAVRGHLSRVVGTPSPMARTLQNPPQANAVLLAISLSLTPP